eukprot:m.170516 g.170516  ORF g.170516 m.170516 type:complete len:73 (+) comp39042_c3_seq18:2965-3183(+)
MAMPCCEKQWNRVILNEYQDFLTFPSSQGALGGFGCARRTHNVDKAETRWNALILAVDFNVSTGGGRRRALE